MNLVADDGDLVDLREPDQRRQFVCGVHPPDRVVRVAQHIGGRVGGKRRLQGGEVKTPPGRVAGQGHLEEPGSGLRDPVKERRVHRRADRHRITRAGQHPEQFDDAYPDIGHGGHRRRVKVPIPAAGRKPGESPAQVRPSHPVPCVGPLDGLAQGFRNRCGEGEVHFSHRQRQHIGWIRLPLRATSLPEDFERVYWQFGYGTVHGHSLPHPISQIDSGAVPG